MPIQATHFFGHTYFKNITILKLSTPSLTMNKPDTHVPTELERLELSHIALRDVFRKHQRFIKDHFKISEQEMEILQFVALNGPRKMKEIGEAFNIKLSTLTSIIDKIEAQKLVKRVNSRTDRRAVYLDLTAKGKKVYDQYSHYIHVMAMLMKRSIQPDHFSIFVEELEHITMGVPHQGNTES